MKMQASRVSRHVYDLYLEAHIRCAVVGLAFRPSSTLRSTQPKIVTI
jgi:hypothetical protein